LYKNIPPTDSRIGYEIKPSEFAVVEKILEIGLISEYANSLSYSVYPTFEWL